jgi:hypothetical protein
VFSDLLIKVIVFLLPTQLGLHFWPAFSRVAGIKVDYLSPTLYFVDILLALLILFNLKSLFFFLKKHLFPLCLFISFSVLNTLFSVSPLNTLFWWLRLDLYLLVFFVLRLRHLQWEDIRMPLIYSTLLIVTIEITQLCLQSSLGGLFYYLGERAFSGSTPGIGRFDLLGLEVLRPIATFSHANSLAGYLLIVFYLFSKKPSVSWYKLVPFVGLLLTFSKSAIIALAFIIFGLKPEIIILVSLVFTFIQPLLQNFSANWQSLSDRLFYYSYLKNIVLQNPFSGVGLGGFISALGKLLPGSFITPAKLQPLHNLPFLIMSEIGLLGSLLLILTFIKNKIHRLLSEPLVLGLLALILFTGAFDHYTWTLPQNKLIFLLALSIML